MGSMSTASPTCDESLVFCTLKSDTSFLSFSSCSFNILRRKNRKDTNVWTLLSITVQILGSVKYKFNLNEYQMSSAGNQKGINAVQICSIENQKGAFWPVTIWQVLTCTRQHNTIITYSFNLNEYQMLSAGNQKGINAVQYVPLRTRRAVSSKILYTNSVLLALNRQSAPTCTT